MADIFGNEPDSYRIVRDLQEQGRWDDYQKSQSLLRFGTDEVRHDFGSLGKGHESLNSDQMRASESAQAVGFLTNNTLAIQTFIDNVLYTAYRLPRYVSINTNIDPGARHYGFKVQNRRGRARRIGADGYDVPSATVGQTLVTRPMHWYGLDAKWSVDELRGAMFAGEPLDTASIDAAIMGSLEKLEEVALVGDRELADGLPGLCNQDTTGDDRVTATDASATFSASTPVAIRNIINGTLSNVIEDSRETIGRNVNQGMTIYLPGTQYDLLTTLYIGDNAEKTLMRSIMEDNPWTHFTDGNPLMIERVLELSSTHNPGSATDRMVVTLKDARICEMGVSIMPRVLSIQDKGREVCAMVESKFSDLFVRRPRNIYYVSTI